MFLKILLFFILIVSSLIIGTTISTWGAGYHLLPNPKTDWIKMFTDIPPQNLWWLAMCMFICGMCTIMYPFVLWMNWKQNVHDNKKRDKALRMHDRMVEALIKCEDEFLQMADEGHYPKRFLTETGGNGIAFITKLIRENEKE